MEGDHAAAVSHHILAVKNVQLQLFDLKWTYTEQHVTATQRKTPATQDKAAGPKLINTSVYVWEQ